MSRSRISPSNSFFLGRRRRQARCYGLFALEAVDGLHAHEDRKRDDHEVDHALDELAVGQDDGGNIALGRLEGDRQVTKIHTTDQQTNGRHHHVAYKRGNNFAEGGADDDTDGHVDHITFDREGLELTDHAHRLFLVTDEKGGAQCKSVVAGLRDTTVNTVSFNRHIKSQIVCKVPPIAREILAVSVAYHINFLIALVGFFYLSSDSAGH